MGFKNSAVKKKIICMLLAFMMFPLGNLAVGAENVTYAVSEDFEKYKIGKPFGNGKLRYRQGQRLRK